ncbi:unnamed protein product [Coffea canephora]|uniref:DUF4228 domain-containing protein n=1 Tax=Coffea canephora TaxID=49390 RepID=A0A068V6U7_COFCA|nr:unnamed protein product [Coffea canephora]
MGCSFSCDSSSVCKNVRVVHLNGHVEEFDYPVSVSEVTAKQPKHFVCTCAQLLSTSSKPVMTNGFLEPGKIYFLLPYSVFQSNMSPVELASLARKLTNIGKSCQSKANSGHRSSLIGLNGGSPACRSPARSPASSPGRFPDVNLRVETENCFTDLLMSPKSRSWKPILATIRERSFNQRSESNLQEDC